MKKDTSFKGRLKALSQKKIFSLICLYIAMVILFTVWAELRHTHFLTVPVFKNILNCRSSFNSAYKVICISVSSKKILHLCVYAV